MTDSAFLCTIAATAAACLGPVAWMMNDAIYPEREKRRRAMRRWLTLERELKAIHKGRQYPSNPR